MTDKDAEIAALKAEVARLRRLDREAAEHVETTICMRTHFTGEPPYVGWKGLGLALSEHLDRAAVALKAAEARVAELEAQTGAARSIVSDVLHWAESRCPCWDDSPNPCPLCGASVENLERCQSAELTLPGSLLAKLRASRALLNQDKTNG